MIYQLMEEYIPEKIYHRDSQVMEMRAVFKRFKETGMGTNLAIMGVTGSGKTTITRKVIDEEDNSIYVNCNETKTPFKTLQAICGAQVKTQSAVLGKCVESLKEKPRVIVLDELDKIKNLAALMNDLNTLYRKTMVPIIVITCKRDIIKQMPSDVRKTLFFHKISLPAYNAFELRDILDDRISKLKFKVDKLDESKRAVMCAISANQGSARVLINLLIRCIQTDDYTQEYIEHVYQEMIKEDLFNFIGDLNDCERDFLALLVESCDYKQKVSSAQLEKEMKVSPGRITQLLNTMEKYGVVQSDYINKGRGGGRQRFAKFTNKEYYEKSCQEMGYE